MNPYMCVNVIFFLIVPWICADYALVSINRINFTNTYSYKINSFTLKVTKDASLRSSFCKIIVQFLKIWKVHFTILNYTLNYIVDLKFWILIQVNSKLNVGVQIKIREIVWDVKPAFKKFMVQNIILV